MIDPGVSPGSTIVNTARVISEDAAFPVEASVSLVVAGGAEPLTITTTSLPAGVTGTAYAASFEQPAVCLRHLVDRVGESPQWTVAVSGG